MSLKKGEEQIALKACETGSVIKLRPEELARVS